MPDFDAAGGFAPEERDIALRQTLLATEIGRRFCGGVALTPHTRHSGSGTLPDCSANGGVAWQTVAEQVGLQIIDHAWRLIEQDGRLSFAWGLVTEPYLRGVDPTDVQRSITQHLADWPLQVHVLTRAESSWYPGSCLPIVFMVKSMGMISVLAKRAREAGRASAG